MCAAALLLGVAVAARVACAATLRVAIPPQPVNSALAAWAEQTGLQVVYVSGVVRGQRSPGAPAGLTAAAALERLLRDTGLRSDFLNGRTVRVRAAVEEPSAPAAPQQLEEVVINAFQVRPESQTVPMSVVAWTQRDLEDAHVEDVPRLANLTPGVEFDAYQDYGAGIETNIAIRGINARDGSAVAVYVDDTPIPTERASTFGRAYPLLFDLARVDVLRGPQGALLGEGAEGGALRFVRTPPSVTAFSASAHTQVATTDGGAGSYELSGEFGAVLWPDFSGIRLSAWSRYDGGYVDRVDQYAGAPAVRNANSAHLDTFSAAWTIHIGSAVRITPAFDYQSRDVEDTSAFHATLSSPGNGVLVNGSASAQPYLDRYRFPSLRVEADLGTAQLVSETAFFDRWAGAFAVAGPPSGGVFGVDAELEERVVSQHLHFEGGAAGARLHWLAGASYLEAHYLEVQDLVTEAFGESGGIDGRLLPDIGTLQIAGFAQADVRLTDRLAAGAALRVERWSFDYFTRILTRSFANEQPVEVSERGESTETAPRFSLTFQPSEQQLYYASAAKGYRMGGANLPLGAECGTTITPGTYAPDSVWSFEVGAKNTTPGGRLQSDVSVFHAVWHDMQLQIPYAACGYGYTANAGAAVSNGVDLGVRASVGERLNLKLLAAYADAHYTQSVYFQGQPVVESGDVVGAPPLVPAPFSATAIADYAVPLSGALLTARAQDVFHSRNHGPFSTDNPNSVVYAPERVPDPPTNQVDLSLSVQWRSLDLSAFVLNAFNAQPTLQLRDRAPGSPPLIASTLRPRTLGLAATWRLPQRASAE